MKTRILLTLIFVFPFIAQAQNPHFAWFQKSNSPYSASGEKVATDKNGNVYVAGEFTVWNYLDTFLLNSNGGNDIFLAKYDSKGKVLWAVSGGSIDDDDINSIVSDKDGNVYITGTFGGNPSSINNNTDTAYFSGKEVISKGGADIFLAKYDTNGNLLWIKSYGSISNDFVSEITINRANRLLITGGFGSYGGSPSVFETINFDSITLISAGDMDIFMASVDNSGNILWAKNFGNNSSEYARNIGVDSFDNIYLSGNFNYFLYFGWNYISSISTGFVAGDFFIAKFDSLGNNIWATSIGGLGTSGGSGYSGGSQKVINLFSLSVCKSGNYYLLGSSDCPLKFQDQTILNNSTIGQNFLIKCDGNGNKIFGERINKPSSGSVFDTWIDNNEQIYCTGYDVLSTGNIYDSISGYSGWNVFVTKYDNTGNNDFTYYLGGLGGGDFGNGIAGDQNGNIFLTGKYASSVFNYGHGFDYYNGYNSVVMYMIKMSYPTSIKDLHNPNSAIELYPNPTTGVIHLQSNKENFSSIKVIDQLGRVLEEQNIYQNQTSIDLHTLPDGIYYVEFLGKNHTQTKKVIIEH